MDKRKLLESHFLCKKLAQTYEDQKVDKYIDAKKKYVNLKYFSCAKNLLYEKDLKQYLELEFIPWKQESGIVLVVTHKVTDELFLFLKKRYKNGFRIYTSSKKSIILAIQRNFSDSILDKTVNLLKVQKKEFSAYYLFNKNAKVIILFIFLLFTFLIFFKRKESLYALFFIANFVFLANTIFKIVLWVASKKTPSFLKIKMSPDLPRYSVIIPLYKEDHVLPHLIKSLKKIKYPKDKLEIIFIVEQFDRRTISTLRKEKEDFFKVICVPRGVPQTKPKACSYVLNYIKGDYLVIYDAEDQPDSNQLLKAVSLFKRGGEKLACIQGKLSFYNSSENILTSFFTIEYFCWFNIFLRGLLTLKMPIPLGGSSNHFKVKVLKKIGGWDPYNVTEDADIGYRLFKEGYEVDVLDSITLEEAPGSLGEWMKQRTRWIKGHLQTYFVHLRTNNLLENKLGKRGVLGFHLFLFFPIASYFLNICMLIFIFQTESYVLFFTFLNYILWLSVSLCLALYSVKKCKQKIHLTSAVLYGFYYLLHSIASICALYRLMTNPFYWEKTEHDFFKRCKSKERAV